MLEVEALEGHAPRCPITGDATDVMKTRLGIRLKLSSYNLFLILTRVITILTFYCLVKNNNLVITILTFLLVKIVKSNNYVITVLTLLLSVNFHVLVLII